MNQLEMPVEGAIPNPNNPQHFMVIKPIDRRIRVFMGETLIAETLNAVRLLEVGRTIYDPVIYVPADDLSQPLQRNEKASHCPLKGDAAYFECDGSEVSWAYVETFDFADDLKGRHAFWPDKVRIEEGG